MTKPPPRSEPSDDPQALQQNFGANLREARMALGMTQDALARACNQDRTHISRIEAGTVNLTMETAGELAAAVGRTVPELLVPPGEFIRRKRRNPKR